ncbi:FAD-binding protein [Saccharicrinis aurantiacus]|uniref:FAD-binding protein n=1 Tax=Saccharicrinis aurantiacus TaxID=1849719 RepID=UPI000839A0EE|nr:FAD-binding protein [Saccharicrinis aurantiacus]
MCKTLNFLLKRRIHFVEDVSLAKTSYLKTGGTVKLLIYPEKDKDLRELINFLYTNKVNYKTVGATTNLLFKDGVDYSCLVSLERFSNMSLNTDEGIFTVDAGASLPEFTRFALYKSSTGFEGLEGIPGSIGGAVYMNAGAYGYEIKDTLIKVETINPEGKQNFLNVSELNLSRRNSIFKSEQQKQIILRCFFKYKAGCNIAIAQRMENYHYKRHKYQDFLYPNLGSMFSGSLYRHLGEKDFIFKIISTSYYLFNYKLKFHRRESPLNRKWINEIVVKRFKLKYDIQPFSDKTINCLVNRGQGTDEMIRYIQEMKQLTNNNVAIENEIVDGF